MSKNKEKKGKESTIGKIIYGFLLFMPLIAIASAILIGTFNMASKEETEITYAYETNEVNTLEDIKIGNVYHFNSNSFSNVQSQTIDEFQAHYDYFYLQGKILNFIKNSQFNYTPDDTDFNNGTYNQFGSVTIESNSYPYTFTYWTNNDGNYPNTFIIEEYNENILIEFDIAITDMDISILNQQFNNQHYEDIKNNFINSFSICENIPIESVETHNIEPTKTFYRAIDEVEQSNLFNWAKNSIVYTTLVTTCNALSITNTFIPMLLAYWLIISVIYILYDIALMMILIFHHKVHCLEDSI